VHRSLTPGVINRVICRDSFLRSGHSHREGPEGTFTAPFVWGFLQIWGKKCHKGTCVPPWNPTYNEKERPFLQVDWGGVFQKKFWGETRDVRMIEAVVVKTWSSSTLDAIKHQAKIPMRFSTENQPSPHYVLLGLWSSTESK